LDSKANLSSYCNEVAKQLHMHYRAPPLPVDLRTFGGGGSEEGTINDMMYARRNSQLSGSTLAGTVPTEVDREAQMKEFRQIALHKHNIRLS
jgi:hypothetical protein